MKIWKKLVILTAALTLSLGMTAAAAETKEGYSYQITLHAGNRGSIDGKDSITLTATYGQTVSFDLSRVKVNDDRYYVKGVRLSGRDNNTVNATAFCVEGDADYVVAYGIKGSLVAYTVKYQDASGKQLAADATFYGNVGDKPIVAYKYIENYVPRALALTKTLSENASENVFTFVYAPGDSGSITILDADTTNVVTIVTPGVTTVNNGTATGGTGNGTTTAGGGNVADADAEENGDEGTDGNEGEVEVTEPDDLVDLDENDTPAANIDLDGQGAKALPMAAAVAIGVGALAALIVLILWIRRRMKSEN